MDGSGGGNPITKELTWYALTDKWILAQKLRIPKIQFAKHRKLKKKEDQIVNTSFLLRMWNKIPLKGVSETKFGADTEGTTTQRLSHLGIHPINHHQTQTLWQMPTRACWQELDIAVSWGPLSVPGKYRSGCSQSSIAQSTSSTMKKPEKYPGSWSGLKPHRRNIKMN